MYTTPIAHASVTAICRAPGCRITCHILVKILNLIFAARNVGENMRQLVVLLLMWAVSPLAAEVSECTRHLEMDRSTKYVVCVFYGRSGFEMDETAERQALTFTSLTSHALLSWTCFLRPLLHRLVHPTSTYTPPAAPSSFFPSFSLVPSTPP